MSTTIEEFSAGYLLAPHIEVQTWRGEAVLDEETYRDIAVRFGEPVIGRVEDIHYHLIPSDEVMGDRAAVPKRNHDRNDRIPLLIAKQ